MKYLSIFSKSKITASRIYNWNPEEINELQSFGRSKEHTEARESAKQETRSDLLKLGSSINPEIMGIAGKVLGRLFEGGRGGRDRMSPLAGLFGGNRDSYGRGGNTHYRDRDGSIPGIRRRRNGSIDGGRSGIFNPLTHEGSRISSRDNYRGYGGERYNYERRDGQHQNYRGDDRYRDEGRRQRMNPGDFAQILNRFGVNLPPGASRLLGGLGELVAQRRGGDGRGLNLGALLGNLDSSRSHHPETAGSRSAPTERSQPSRSADGKAEKPEVAKLKSEVEGSKGQISGHLVRELTATHPSLSEKIKTEVPKFWDNFMQEKIISNLGKKQLPALNIDQDIRLPLAQIIGGTQNEVAQIKEHILSGEVGERFARIFYQELVSRNDALLA